MFLATIAKNNASETGPNAGWLWMTSENFTMIIQNFQRGDNHIGESNGFILPLGVGGYRVNEVTFQRPGYVLTPWNLRADGDLINELLSAKRRRKSLFTRLLRATDLLYESYYNDPKVSLNARHLLQVAAFEVLLDLPDDGHQRKNLKDAIEKYTTVPSDKYVTYSYETRSGNRRERNTIKVMWADRFYTLRNHIIHGNKIRLSDFIFYRQRHIDIAIKFFSLVVRRLLAEPRIDSLQDQIIWGKFDNDYGRDIPGFVYEDHAVARALRRSI